MHVMKLMISVSVETLLDQVGIKKYAFLQIFHTTYSLKSLYTAKLCKVICSTATNSTWNDISKPVLRRWEYVGDATRHLTSFHEQRLVMSHYIINLNNIGKL